MFKNVFYSNYPKAKVIFSFDEQQSNEPYSNYVSYRSLLILVIPSAGLAATNPLITKVTLE